MSRECLVRDSTFEWTISLGGLDNGATLVCFSTPGDQPKLCTLTSADGIIWCPVVVEVEVLLDPLQHLKVVLVFSAHELGRVYKACDVVLLKGSLQYLVVVGILVVMLSAPVHFTHLHCAGVDSVHDLAVNCTRGALLYLLDTELEEG